VSLNGSANPLQIELAPSRYYRRVILISHLLTLLLATGFAWQSPLMLLAIPLILLSLRNSLRLYEADSGWRHLRCYRDGRVERVEEGGQRLAYRLRHSPVIFPWIVVLPLGVGRARRWLPLWPDAMGRGEWLALRRFLRYSLD
jgi:hypothetical protein